ncbi:UNVERIFIED_CONTAM: hypothetical protein BJ099_10823 [Lysinibacillus xylanilyticus]|uniref:hypothetical protein n=1 Tax=Lysinibacillus xylanilyticus TaxID=582475 RepID=UPI000A8E6289|nr:hypothetical protein [Lysinibacillus xylanilyticus]
MKTRLEKLIISLNFTEATDLVGSLNKAFYHARKAVELDEEDIELKEYLLFFYEKPDKLLSNQEAKTLAEEIINLNPKREVGKQYI